MQRVLKRVCCAERGFTLIELLVAVAVLGVVSAVAVLNVGVFVGAGSDEASMLEQRHVQTAVVAYMAEGNLITTEFVVCPGAKGVLAPYLLRDLKYCWLVNQEGQVFAVETSGDSGGASSKNLFNPVWLESGGIDSITGEDRNTPTFMASYYRTNELVLVQGGLAYSISYDDADLFDPPRIYWYNESGEFLSASGGASGTAPIDAYYARFRLHKWTDGAPEAVQFEQSADPTDYDPY